ncbi:thioesterase family protein [Pacificimonas sp. WHA3]|uniref:Thioesterase family protein n=1 Tax=Pacificimonas pallii TaxID=2827236 RepID=A0ABS6SHH7_9SPHN|nr:thioesterase family protein [Pacificimonas pallii]MBV7257297.1 thioesterase family protein [Pacificimonas pallii]
MSLPRILAGREPVKGGYRAVIPDAWLQGRTAYGGLSAAMAYAAARDADADLPPLRSAQVSFIGPLAGPVTVTAAVKRRGKNAAFVTAEIHGENGLGLAATFVFMREMKSHVELTGGTAAPISSPPGPARPVEHATAPRFLHNFDIAQVDDWPDRGSADVLRWFRTKDRDGLDPMTEMMLIGDGLPPAAMALMTKPVPVSSLTWIYNLLTPAPVSADGWWLLRATSDHIEHGCTNQDIMVWNADGALVARGMQSIALFG